MSIFEYDEEKHMRTVREEGYEEGVNWGIERGLEQVIRNMLQQNQPVELISQCVQKPVEYIYAVKRELQGEISEEGKHEKEEEKN